MRLPLGPYVHGGSPDSGPVPVRDTPRALPTEAESQIAGRKRRLWVESGWEVVEPALFFIPVVGRIDDL